MQRMDIQLIYTRFCYGGYGNGLLNEKQRLVALIVRCWEGFKLVVFPI